MNNVKSRTVLPLLALLLAFVALPRAFATFSSIYVFGDGVCTTTDSPSPASLYYGGRYCNGPVWIEKISTLQGLTYDVAKNNSFFGHYSAVLKTSVNNFAAPADAATSLFIVWSNDADFVDFNKDSSLLWKSSSQAAWDTKIATAINNLTTAINTLYAKGARKIVMPNAVNIAAAPAINRPPADESFFRDRVMQYNTEFQTATTSLMNNNPGLVIYRPDVFSYFEQIIANPGGYGFTNATSPAVLLSDKSFNGPGANYVFWDYWHPTTKFQNLLADFVNQSIPVPVVDMTRLLQNVSITPAGTGLPGISGEIQGGPPNGEVILQASADLGTSDLWRDIATIPLDSGGNQSFGPIFDPQGQGLSHDFFRIKLPLNP